MRGAPIVALAAALLGACAQIDYSPDEWSYDGPVNSCRGGCAAGTCDPGLGVCAVDPPAAAQLIARVVPDSSTGVPAQAFAVDVGGGAAELLLSSPVDVQAKTLAGAGDDVASLQARVIFSDVGNRLPGRPARVTVYEAYYSAVLDLALLPGPYDVIVIPGGGQAPSFPVAYLDGLTVDADGKLLDSDGEATDVIVPPAAAWVKGRITQVSAPVNGLEVVAFDPATGRTVSTSDSTVCAQVSGETVCGYFEIGLAKSAVDSGAAFSLRVSRPSEPTHPVFVAEGFTPPAAGGWLNLVGDSRLDFGALGVPVRARIVVLKPVRDAAGAIEYVPAPSCFVALAAPDVAAGSVETWVLTDESGEIEDAPGIVGVNLYAGDYAVTVIPSHAATGAAADYAVYASAEPWAVSEETAAVPLEIRLAERPIAAGAVLAGGKTVPTSAVFAEPAPGEASTARPNAGITGTTGRFGLRLDEASYVVAAEAPQESLYAWDLAEAAVTGASQAFDLELPLPFVQRGTVGTSPDQLNDVDLAGAVVEWYRVVDGRAYAVGRTAIDDDGGFAALLPP